MDEKETMVGIKNHDKGIYKLGPLFYNSVMIGG